jgi:hypothetical protein
MVFLLQLGSWMTHPDHGEMGLFLEAVIGLLTLVGLREIITITLWTLAIRRFDDDLRILRLD